MSETLYFWNDTQKLTLIIEDTEEQTLPEIPTNIKVVLSGSNLESVTNIKLKQ